MLAQPPASRISEIASRLPGPRDYVESLTGRDTSGDAAEIRPDLGGLEVRVAAARARTERAQRESAEAAAEARAVARECQKAGLSVTDTAVVLGVSRGRVSQLSRQSG